MTIEPGYEPFEVGVGVGVDPDLDVRAARTGTLLGLDVGWWASVNVDPLAAGATPEPLSDPDLTGAELVEWCATQVGCAVVATVPWLYANCELVTVERALRTRGALLLSATSAAVCLGFSQVAQVSGDRYVLRVVPDGDTTWDTGALLPGVWYTTPSVTPTAGGATTLPDWVTGDPYSLYTLWDDGESYSPWGGDGFQTFVPTTDLVIAGVRVNSGGTAALYGPTGQVLVEWTTVGSGWTWSEVVFFDTPVTLSAGVAYSAWSSTQAYTTVNWLQDGSASATLYTPADGTWPGTRDEENNSGIRMPLNLWGWDPDGPGGGGDT